MEADLRLEFHCHTRYSNDCLTRLETLVAACRRKGIDRVVISDHNTIAGAVAARDLAPDLVIVGEEIMTQEGELLAAFVREEIPPGLPARQAIARLRDQGAFISVAHPFDRWRKGHWRTRRLVEVLPLVDAVEIFNARCVWPGFNRAAQAFVREHGVSGTVGSDAHTAWELGRGLMVLPAFEDAESLRRSMTRVRYRCRLSPPWIHLASRYAVWKKKRAGGLVAASDEG